MPLEYNHAATTDDTLLICVNIAELLLYKQRRKTTGKLLKIFSCPPSDRSAQQLRRMERA